MTKEELIAWRKKRGLSQSEVAEMLGISRSRYQDYELGATRGPRSVPAPIPRVVELALAELARHNEERI